MFGIIHGSGRVVTNREGLETRTGILSIMHSLLTVACTAFASWLVVCSDVDSLVSNLAFCSEQDVTSLRDRRR